MKFKSTFLNEFFERGFMYQASNIDALDDYLYNNKNARAYIGFDMTADSLHVGHLTQIFILRLFQKHGYTPVVLIGGGTTKIGDPSGRDKSRSMLSEEDIAKNIESISSCLKNFFDMKAENAPIFVNNDTWLSSITFITFLRDIGMHFSVNKMLSLDSVSSRLSNGNNLTFLEFSYSLLQSYDFMQLLDKHNCMIEFGGSDQWGNIVSGIELIRKLRAKEVFGLTTPLLTTSDGKKMGKTASGAVWLNKDKLSSFDFWQFWRNTNDLDVIKFMKLFTDLPLDQIREYEKLTGEDINKAKIVLANEVTKICRGADDAKDAEQNATKIFQDHSINSANVNIQLKKSDVLSMSITDLFVITGLCNSKGEAKKLILGNGAYLNDIKISEIDQKISLSDINDNRIKLSAGKKKFSIIECI